MVVAAGTVAFVLTSSAGRAEQVHDHIGSRLGCDENPSGNPYCTSPVLRALFQEQHVLTQEISRMPEVTITPDMGVRNGMSGTLPGNVVLIALSLGSLPHEMDRCDGNEVCMLAIMRETTRLLRRVSGRPENEAMFAVEDVMAIEAGQAAETERLRRPAEEITETYRVEWERSLAMLTDQEVPLFRWRNPPPDIWLSRRTTNCRGDLECLADPTDIERLITVQRDAVARQEAETAAAEQLERELRAAEERRAREQRDREAQRAALVGELAAIDVDRLIAVGSQLRSALYGDFTTFDE